MTTECTDAVNLAPRHQVATYCEQAIPAYQGNPFLEALPPIIESRAGIEALLRRELHVPTEQRAWAPGLRRHLLGTLLASYMYPLERDIAFYADFDTVLRTAYIGRNPNSPDFGWNAPSRGENLAYAAQRIMAAPNKFGAVSCRAVLGHSGLGKTKMVEEVAARYPQVILHKNLTGPFAVISQVVWMKINCPHDGSTRGFCITVLAELDRLLGTSYQQEYGKRGTVDSMTSAIARLATLHGIGVLIVDEIRNLRQAPPGGEEKMLNFFKQLGDVTRISIIAVGTAFAELVLGGDFQNARRNTGCHMLQPLGMEEFLHFSRGLLDGIVLQDAEEPDLAFFELLWDATLGIHDLVIKLFGFTQDRALELGQEKLTVDLLLDAYNRRFHLLIPHLDEMRRTRGANVMAGELSYEAPPGTAEVEQKAVTAKRSRTKRNPKLDAKEALGLLREANVFADLVPDSVEV